MNQPVTTPVAAATPAPSTTVGQEIVAGLSAAAPLIGMIGGPLGVVLGGVVALAVKLVPIAEKYEADKAAGNTAAMAETAPLLGSLIDDMTALQGLLAEHAALINAAVTTG